MGILLVYDVTDERSFNNIRTWHANIEQHASEGVNKILVGNKCDWDDKKVRLSRLSSVCLRFVVVLPRILLAQVISTEQGQELARELGVRFLETSAKANINVEQAFTDLARCVRVVTGSSDC